MVFGGSLEESFSLLRSTLDEVEDEVSLRSFDPSLDKFINDEESIKAEELLEERTLTLDRVAVPEGLKLPEGSLRMTYAIDASSVVLGECGRGVVFAVRGVVVRWDPWLQKSVIVRLMESPCYVSYENSKRLYNSLRRKLLGLSEVEKPPNPMKMVDRVPVSYTHLTLPTN